MPDDKRPAYELMRDLLNHDEPIYKAARDGIETNFKAWIGVAGAAEGLRALMTDVFYDAYATMYDQLCADIRPGYPVKRNVMEWTRTRITREAFDAIDWPGLVYDLAEDLIDEYGLTAEERNTKS